LKTFTRHTNAYCLDVEVTTLYIEYLKKEEPPDAREIAIQSEKAKTHLEECRSQLATKKNKRSYEIDWLKNACELLRRV
jgi:hypothetical protein